MIINSKNQIYLEIALLINQDLYAEQKIPYYLYKTTEESLLQRLRETEKN